MSAEANKTLVRRWFEEFCNRQNLDILDDLYAPSWGGHFPGSGDLHGAEGHKPLGRMFHVAFPDARYTVDDIMAEDDRVLARYTMRATHQGEMLGVPPTGRQVIVTGMNQYRIADGKIVEQWAQFDTFGLMRQLGVMPSSR